jgi:lipopolysaccharide transport system permease protein
MPVADRSNSPSAWDDWWQGTRQVRLWWTLASKDIVDRYRRSMLGPLWLTLSVAAMLVAMGPLYSQLFKVPIDKFFPNLALGIILWGFINSTLLDAANTFIAASTFLKSSPFPLSMFIWRTLARNVISLAHQLIVYVPVALLCRIPISPVQLLCIPGFLMLLVCLHVMAISVAVVCTRFRDVTQVLTTCLQMVIFVTPVLWMPSSVPARAKLLLYLNPFFHMIDVVRAPLLGQLPQKYSWPGLLLWTGACAILAMVLFTRSRRLVIYWL